MPQFGSVAARARARVEHAFLSSSTPASSNRNLVIHAGASRGRDVSIQRNGATHSSPGADLPPAGPGTQMALGVGRRVALRSISGAPGPAAGTRALLLRRRRPRRHVAASLPPDPANIRPRMRTRESPILARRTPGRTPPPQTSPAKRRRTTYPGRGAVQSSRPPTVGTEKRRPPDTEGPARTSEYYRKKTRFPPNTRASRFFFLGLRH